MTIEICDATQNDLPAITDIYNDAVLNTTAIWSDILFKHCPLGRLRSRLR